MAPKLDAPFAEDLERPARRPVPALPTDVANHVRSALKRTDGLKHLMEKELERCFGVDRLDGLIRTSSTATGARVDLHIPRTVGDTGVHYLLEVDAEEVRLSARLPEVLSIASDEYDQFVEMVDDEMLVYPDAIGSVELDDEKHSCILDRLFELLVRHVFTSLTAPFSPAYYLPADRTGVMHSHQVVVSTLVQHAATAGLRPSTQVPMLSGVLADFLSELIKMSGDGRTTRRKSRTSENDYAARMEQHILQGAVRLHRSGTGYPSFTYRPTGWKQDLPLMRASSMVSELAPIVLYLRHLVRPGQLLIIEEPEAHLHPGMQAALTRELASLVTAGVRIVVTTHSEWILEQLGNLVRLSGVPETNRDGIAGADCALRPDQVGAWLFKPSDDSQGAVVNEIEFDSETGLYQTDFDAVSETLYNENATIFNRMQGDDSG